MRVERIRKEKTRGGCRLAADVCWEDRECQSRVAVIETTDQFAGDVDPSPDAFLLALAPIAQWQGEARIHVDGSVCPRLRDGLAAATELFTLWHSHCRPMKIEPSGGFTPTNPRPISRTGSFLSGGIDALSLLRRNRLNYPGEHPGSIRDGIMLHGVNPYDHDGTDQRPERTSAFQSYTERMQLLAEQEAFTLVPLYTNIRTFYPHPAWGKIGFGAGIASTALCLGRRIDRIEMGSAGLRMRHRPEGSHPSLDHNFSTEAVQVHHADVSLSRLAKLRILSEWPEGLAVLRPCFGSVLRDDALNCGQCEKCIRTMVGLVALGMLDRAPTFAADDVSREMLEPVWIDGDNTLPFYTDCVEPLRARGRLDLVDLILAKTKAYHIWQRRQKVAAVVGGFGVLRGLFNVPLRSDRTA
ncbi:MAG: hypothetical protein ABI556_10055 [Gemmatimonadales bacterium]